MKTTLTLIILVIAGSASAQQVDMPRDAWLTNLKPIMMTGLCNGDASPFMRTFNGTREECLEEVQKLFHLCAKDEPRVVLPNRFTSIPQANTSGQVMAECISAHYQKGPALDAFYLLQDLSNNRQGK